MAFIGQLRLEVTAEEVPHCPTEVPRELSGLPSPAGPPRSRKGTHQVVDLLHLHSVRAAEIKHPAPPPAPLTGSHRLVTAGIVEPSLARGLGGAHHDQHAAPQAEVQAAPRRPFTLAGKSGSTSPGSGHDRPPQSVAAAARVSFPSGHGRFGVCSLSRPPRPAGRTCAPHLQLFFVASPGGWGFEAGGREQAEISLYESLFHRAGLANVSTVGVKRPEPPLGQHRRPTSQSVSRSPEQDRTPTRNFCRSPQI